MEKFAVHFQGAKRDPYKQSKLVPGLIHHFGFKIQTRSKLLKTLNKVLHAEPYSKVQKARIRALFEVMTVLSDSTIWQDTWPANTKGKGMAIAPIYAAHCLSDCKRTTAFSSGLHDAIEEAMQRFPDQRPIRILYAGTGPFATLALPSMAKFSPEDIQFDFIDIHETSTQNLSELLEKLDFEDFAQNIITKDVFDHQDADGYHIAITETMGPALANEPQIPIMRHIRKMLVENGILLPEEIQLGLLIGNDNYQVLTPMIWKYTALEDKAETFAPLEIRYQYQPKEPCNEEVSVFAATQVKVFADNLVTFGHTSITDPIGMGTLPNIPPNSSIEVAYRAGQDLVYGTEQPICRLISK
ncbi:hypothetical protein JKY72_02605 [Candidatus Gracilibacteria bacterium]|nr:hypothetical protein [Candidatus Gracilibacteria bacterium]